ncbi:Sec-independent protein translocase subunit TatA/TatB [Pedobacter deserti]|uniref:Sec-independent protein translocase subunit TatA/TatB n=1 Tax=Pedobacter deserti TaxID=2817382 RepID=UPI00210F1EED|nr:twin-arginine translocase TatA/TatE family subunit [Pedobacter sp. SYSU D00382]
MYIGTLAEFLNIGGGEMVLIVAAILLLFGGKKLPELARGLGKGIREFKDASDDVKREIHRNINAVSIKEDIDEMIRDAKDDMTESGTAAVEEETTEEEDFEKPAPPVETGIPNTVPMSRSYTRTDTATDTEKTNS